MEVQSNFRPIGNAVCPDIVNESPANGACLDIGTDHNHDRLLMLFIKTFFCLNVGHRNGSQ
jgi:hypothetical protein